VVGEELFDVITSRLATHQQERGRNTKARSES